MLELKREYFPKGTNGALSVDGTAICRSIELPWMENKPQVSCIPEGEYRIKTEQHARFGKVIRVLGVPGRSGILMHPANNALKELKGCVAPVMAATGQGTGMDSRKATDKVFEAVQLLEKRGEARLRVWS